jgi:hypothetical protein
MRTTGISFEEKVLFHGGRRQRKKSASSLKKKALQHFGREFPAKRHNLHRHSQPTSTQVFSEVVILMMFADTVHGVLDGGAGAEAEDHPNWSTRSSTLY